MVKTAVDGNGSCTPSGRKKVQSIFQFKGVRSVFTLMTAIEELRSRSGYIGVRAASKLTTRSTKTLNLWIAAGTMKAYRIGNANMIDRAYLADWLEARELATV
jgi:hypothetical protein